MGVGGQCHAQAALYQERDPAPTAAWAAAPVWAGAENLKPSEIRSRTIQPVANRLYRLRYPCPQVNISNILNNDKIVKGSDETENWYFH
jgi:hypothetical protein